MEVAEAARSEQVTWLPGHHAVRRTEAQRKELRLHPQQGGGQEPRAAPSTCRALPSKEVGRSQGLPLNLSCQSPPAEPLQRRTRFLNEEGGQTEERGRCRQCRGRKSGSKRACATRKVAREPCWVIE